MKEVEGVVVALYKPTGDYHRFAVLKRDVNWEGWELPKGRLDDTEDPEKAARREIKEETSIEPVSITDLDEIHEWEYEQDGEKRHAKYHAFMAEAPENAFIDVSDNPDKDEHSKGHFLNLRDTKDVLTHENQRELVEKVAERLQEQ
ncbi:MAG: NUDIX domain-containing protein [Candidatus Nanohaloarchaea archaeon]|nr:NUDIX domain-containing protein [Candidatus Nanohaloarchaea archaeon]